MCVAEQIHVRLGASFHELAVVVAGTPLGWETVTSASPTKLPRVPPVEGRGKSGGGGGGGGVEGAAVAEAGAEAEAGAASGGGENCAEEEGDCWGTTTPISHTGHYVAPPFTALRVSVVSLLADLVYQDPSHIEQLPLDLWRVLASLFFQYPHSDMFHFQVY